MKKSIATILLAIFVFASCQKQEFINAVIDDIQSSFREANNKSFIDKEMVEPLWNDSIRYGDDLYIPLKSDQYFSINKDSVEYSLSDKLWLVANKSENRWGFKVATLHPNNLKDYNESGVIMYENFADGKLTQLPYNAIQINDKINRPESKSSRSTTKIALLREVEKCERRRIKTIVEGVEHWACRMFAL